MKLLMVTPYFYPKIGGLEKYAYNFALGLKKRYKWEVVVVTSNHKTKKNETEIIQGMRVYRLAPLFKISNTPINPFWIFNIKKIIKEEKPNLINAHTPVPFMADIASFAAGKIPFILTYHAFKLQKYNDTLFNIVISMYKLWEYIIFKKTKKIIIVSDVIKPSISQQFRKKISVINNSLESTDIPKEKNRETTKELNIIFIGSLDKTHVWKGLDDIIMAIKIYSEKNNTPIHLSIIGEGDDMPRYKELVRTYNLTKKITFYGKKEGKAKSKILQEVNCAIIYPKSENDAFPTVALEYWAHSLPIIAANIMPIKKLFVHKKTAYLVKANNPFELSSAIKKLFRDKELTKILAKNGLSVLNENFLLESELNKYHLLLKGVSL